MKVLHGIGYGLSAGVATKDLYQTGRELREMYTEPDQQPIISERWKLSSVKVAKLFSDIGTALTGFGLLLVTSTKLSFMYLGFSTSSLACSLSGFMIDKSSDPAVKQQKVLEKKLQREKTFQMIT